MTLTRWVHNYVERHTASVINEQVEKRCQGAEFLQAATPDVVALFERREIKTGLKLGSGAFSDVYEVTRIKLLKSGQSIGVENARMTCRWNTERGKYAIKLAKRPGNREIIGSSRGTWSSGRESNSTHKFPEYTKASIDLIIEGRFLSVLDHKHIIKVRGLSCGPSPFIIMDRLDDTLDRRIAQWRQQSTQEQALILPQGATFALQMADAIKYLHDRRIIMRDVKPANVGIKKDVDGKEMVQLFDMGLCRELPHGDDQEDSFLMSMAGTLRYMAVEIVNTGFYGLKADVYSWAVVAYEMLTLEIPYKNQCANAGMHRRFVCREGERPVFPEQGRMVPAPLQKLIQNSWAQEPQDRPSIASVHYQLEHLLVTNFEVKSYPDTPPTSMCPSLFPNTISASA
jgi:serine/threonine protein kinase